MHDRHNATSGEPGLGAAPEPSKPEMYDISPHAAHHRVGYYPALFYPKIGALARDFLPLFTTAYYVHNFNGSGGGALFRSARTHNPKRSCRVGPPL